MRESDATVIGRVIVGRGTLRIETNSENRADALGVRVREACAGLLRNRKRDIQPPTLEDAAASEEPPAERSPEEQAVIREFKEDHYRKWLDMPIPALAGKTPRAAARSAKSRRELDLLLREMKTARADCPRRSDSTWTGFAASSVWSRDPARWQLKRETLNGDQAILPAPRGRFPSRCLADCS